MSSDQTAKNSWRGQHNRPAKVAIQRIDRFVARTTNWLYDHLCSLVDYRPVVVCDDLQNRAEYPALEAWRMNPAAVPRRVWRRFISRSMFPIDLWRLRKLAPAVLHSHFGYLALGDAQLRKSLDLPWIVSFYGADIYQRPARAAQQYAGLFREADAVLALGPAMKRCLEAVGCPPEKVLVHPLGVPVDSIPFTLRTYDTADKLRILFAGTFREKKGIPYLLEGAAMARRKGLRLEIRLVGDAAGKPGDLETKTAVFDQIRHLGLEDVVIHHKYVSFPDLVSIALQCHVFVAPSVTAADGDSEGTPFVLQQLMATGMPVIATQHSDIPYIMGDCGSLVPERDSPAICRALQCYVDDPALLAAHGTAMRSRIAQAFDVVQCARNLCTIYDSMMNATEDSG